MSAELGMAIAGAVLGSARVIWILTFVWRRP